jgi:hypothetical protein
MTDVTDIRFARIGGVLDGVEEKAGAVPPKGKGKGPKVRPKPPWLTEDTDPEDAADGGADEDTEDEGDDTPPRRRGGKKALPASRKPPAGWTAKKPVPAQNTAKARRRQTVTSPRGNLARVQHSSRGQAVSMRTLPAPRGIKAKSAEFDEKTAARPTVWGPPSQSVDITRVRVAGTGHDARISAQAGQRSNGPHRKPGTGSAGGNGVTRGRGAMSAVNHTPDNVTKPGGRGKVRHSGQMGEGSVRGRSGSAITPHRPGNIKALYDYSPDELQSAMDIAAKAIRGVLRDFDTAED